jgi:S1-C subfamily serine protease
MLAPFRRPVLVRYKRTRRSSVFKRQIFGVALISLLAGSLCSARQWLDDEGRGETLRLLPDAATNQLISSAIRKSAFLFYGMEVTTQRADSNQITLAINGPTNSYLGAAIAVAIDARGYFLTAAHVLGSPRPFTLVFHDGSTVRSAPARVVAQIPESLKSNRPRDIARTLDLALLHADNVQPGHVFSWAEINPKPRQDSVVIQLGEAAGRFRDTNAFIHFSAVAGRLRKVISLRSGGTVLQSETPGRPGDSGGPLMNTSGELLAITSGLDVRLFGKSLATATRPDLSWLRDTIEHDQRTPAVPTRHTSVRNDGQPAYVSIRLEP